MESSNPRREQPSQHYRALFYALLEEFPQAREELEALALSRVAHLLPELERVTPPRMAIETWERGDWGQVREQKQAWATFRVELELAVSQIPQAELTDWVSRWVKYPLLYADFDRLARDELTRMTYAWSAQPTPPTPRLPDLRDYRILIRNLRGEGYTRIARALGLSVGGVTKGAQRLKAEMGLTIAPNKAGRPANQT